MLRCRTEAFPRQENRQENDLVWTKEDPLNACGSPVTTPTIVFMLGEG